MEQLLIPQPMKQITLHQFSFNGKLIGYSSETMFLVQVGKGAKGKYSTKYSFKGDPGKAIWFYNRLNIGNGYKKRLLMPSSKHPVLAKSENRRGLL